MEKILVILTCFNRKEKTLNCIKSLVEGNTNLNFSFVIVDDNSNDGTQGSLQELPYDMKILNGNGSLYWAGGMRKGIEYCYKNNLEYQYVLFVNDDVLFHSGVIEKLVQQESNRGVVIVGATSNSLGEFTYGAIKHNRNKFKELHYSVEPGFKNPCDTFNMNCVLVPKEVFVKIGNLDSVYQHSLADLDYGFRIKQKGYHIYSSSFYVGVCEKNSIEGTWQDKNLSVVDRFKAKESIKGAPFKPWVYYLKKNFGLIIAVRYSLSPYLRIFLGR